MLPNVQAALASDGWTVKKGTITIIKGNYQFFIDVSAAKDGKKVAIEVKSFLNNFVYDWHLALGQFLTYNALLFKLDPDRVLYLAVPEEIYIEHLQSELFQELVELYLINLLIFSHKTNHVVAWKRQ